MDNWGPKSRHDIRKTKVEVKKPARNRIGVKRTRGLFSSKKG